MRKFISTILLVCFLANSGIIALSAIDFNDNSAKSSNLVCDVLSDECLEHSFSNQILPIDAKISINSTVESVISNILYDDTLNIDGNIIIDGNTIGITEYLNDAQLDRFDAIDIIYEEGLISEEERIDCFCSLLNSKKVENEECLFKITTILQAYYERSDALDELKIKIEKATRPPEYRKENNLSNLNSETSTFSLDSTEGIVYTLNFEIHYDSSVIGMHDQAVAVGNWFEHIRDILIIQENFREPLKYGLGITTYPVYLSSESSSSSGVTGIFYDSNNGSNAYATYIVIYNFTSLTDQVRKTCFHEYFHAIQMSYFRDLGNLWFYEATATWCSIVYGGSSSVYDSLISGFLLSPKSINYGQGYASVLLPLTIHKSYGGTSTIKAIWERYGTVWARVGISELDFGDLIYYVLNPGLNTVGSTFDEVFLTMACYNFYPDIWYESVHPENSAYLKENWINGSITDAKGYATSGQLYTICNNVSLPSYANTYYRFDPDVICPGKSGKLTLIISFSGSMSEYGVCQDYFIGSDNIHYYGDIDNVNLSKTGNNEYTIVYYDYGGFQDMASVVISNLTFSSMNFSVRLKFEEV